ncbi:hypothetical protein Fmac_001535 [Flemingia macrophylla]|uniref:Uncharacterized protein n=1 Tax=Flemingia macrophylla TaxID=520843 RepID=A0ABD1NHD3_9FABA
MLTCPPTNDSLSNLIPILIEMRRIPTCPLLLPRPISGTGLAVAFGSKEKACICSPYLI